MTEKSASIVFLWTEVVGYLQAVLDILSEDMGVQLCVVHWDKRSPNSTQYVVNEKNGVRFHKRSQTDRQALLTILERANPRMVVISGWMDKGYIWACRKYKEMNPNVIIVAGIDDIWIGSIRQRVGQIYFRMFYRALFDYFWISGQPQFSYAQRFGYGLENTISHLYSADTRKFKNFANISKRFVFVGRFVKIKALDLLTDAYCCLPASIQEEWPLYLIGDGEQRNQILARKNENIHILPFLQPDALNYELQKGGVGCLPTHKEQWGVVLHEFARIGMPILASSGCGASTEFLISGFNGFMFKKGDSDSLRKAMLEFTKLSDNEYARFSQNSRLLGSRITSETSAASLLSVLRF